MKNKSADNLKKFISVAVGALLVLASLAVAIPAFASPDQGDGYWSDTFTDSTGINASASTNISVSGGDVTLAVDTQDTPVVAFNDSFETTSINTSKWTNSGWTSVTDYKHDGSRSVKATRWQTSWRTYNLTSADINLSAATSATLDFYFMEYWSLSNSGYLNVYYYDGSNWNFITRVDTAVSSYQNNWEHFTASISLPTYRISNFRIRFEARVAYSTAYWIDQLTVTKTVTIQPYCTSGVLTSINISPTNLQSWETFTAGADNTWPYKKPITITNAGAALTDYQVNFSVGYVSGKMNADFSDLRFNDGSGNALSYWIESYTAGSTAKVWVKVPSIAAGGTTTIYMYYGNTQASSASNGANTFIFFDDFSSGLSKWTKEKNGANISIVSGQLECVGGFPSGTYGHTVLGSSASYNTFQNGIIEADIYPSTDALPEIIFRGVNASNTGYKGRWDTRAGTESPWMSPPYNGWQPFGTGVTRFGLPNQWQQAKLVINGSTFSIYRNGALQSTVTNTSYPGSGEIGLSNHYGNYTLFDNVRVRKYAATEPAVTLGSEETVGITYQILNAADDSVLCTVSAAEAAAGYDISSCAGTTSAIKLRANMISTNSSLTPVLHDWQVTFIPTYNLTVTASSGGGVTNPGEGTFTYGSGTIVDISAVPDPCYTFAGWSGDTGTIADINDPTTTITMNSNCSIQAEFAIITYTLSVSGNNSGGTPYFDGTSPFDCNTTAVIHANTSSCAVFAGWTGDGIENPNAENTNVSMTQDRTVTANYIITRFNLSYSAGPNGALDGATLQTVDCGTSGSAVTAVPDYCYHFVNWSDGSTANPRVDANVIANITVTANFAINISTLSLTADPIAGGSPYSNGSSFNCGATAAIHANTSSCAVFAGWTPEDGIDNPSAENTTVVMNVSRSLTANYIIKTYDLSYSAGPNGTLNGATFQTVDCGTSGSAVTAVPDYCYRFVNWSDGSTANPRTDANVIANITATANFEIITYTLSVTANNTGGTPHFAGTSPFNCGDNVTIYAGTKPDYMFAGWTPEDGIDDPNAENTSVSMTQNRSLIARYIPIPHTIDITAPSAITSWALGIGTNTNSGSLAVNVTPNSARWSATVLDNDSTTSGYMTGWNGTAYNPLIKLINAMRVSGPDAEATLPNTGETAIAHGTGDYPGIDITFTQEVTWSDEPGTYQIIVTFIGTVY